MKPVKTKAPTTGVKPKKGATGVKPIQPMKPKKLK